MQAGVSKDSKEERVLQSQDFELEKDKRAQN